MPALIRPLAFALAIALVPALAACGPTIGLAPGLTARMDAPGAQLDTKAALGLVNQLRHAQKAPALTIDAELEAKAKQAAKAYSSNGKSPARPDGADAILTSAGYVTFAETFSGWRSSSNDTTALSDPAMTRAGLAVVWSGSSEFGSYWVLLMGK